MKKIVAIVFLSLIGSLALAGCSLAPNSKVVKSEQDIFSYAFLSAADMISQSTDQTTLSFMAVDEPVTEEPVTDEPVTEEPIVEDVDPILEKYLQLVETYLSNAVIQVEEKQSDRAEYETMLVYSATDLLGEPMTFTVYYNQVVLNDESGDIEEPESEEPEEETRDESENKALRRYDRNHDKDDDFEDEYSDELEYELTGLIVINDVEYELVGRKEIEEGEAEYKFIAYMDQDNFIKISYEKDEEDGDQKFYYKQVSNGLLVYETKIKLELDDQRMKVMLTYNTGETSGKYKFMQSDDALFDIMVKFELYNGRELIESGHAKIYINVDEVTGETTYEYDLLGTKYGHQHHHHNGFDRSDRNRDDENKGR